MKMNNYKIRVNNAVIYKEALNEWLAMKDTGIFSGIGDMIDYVRSDIGTEDLDAWIYQVELNGGLTLAYVKKVK